MLQLWLQFLVLLVVVVVGVGMSLLPLLLLPLMHLMPPMHLLLRPPFSSPCALLLIPQGLGAFTFHSFQPQRTISPQLFIGAAALSRSVRVQASVRATSAERKNIKRRSDMN